MPVSREIVSVDLPNNGWGEPWCRHTVDTLGCWVCESWRFMGPAVRLGVAATARIEQPGLYARPSPVAVAAAMEKLRQVRARSIPGGMAPAFARTVSATPAGASPVYWTMTTTVGAGKAVREFKPPNPPAGPGTELLKFYHFIGLPKCSQCMDLAAKMDQWGVAGCREHLDEIVADIEKRKNMVGIFQKALVGGRLLKNKLPLTIRGQVLLAIDWADKNSKSEQS